PLPPPATSATVIAQGMPCHREGRPYESTEAIAVTATIPSVLAFTRVPAVRIDSHSVGRSVTPRKTSHGIRTACTHRRPTHQEATVARHADDTADIHSSATKRQLKERSPTRANRTSPLAAVTRAQSST